MSPPFLSGGETSSRRGSRAGSWRTDRRGGRRWGRSAALPLREPEVAVSAGEGGADAVVGDQGVVVFGAGGEAGEVGGEFMGLVVGGRSRFAGSLLAVGRGRAVGEVAIDEGRVVGVEEAADEGLAAGERSVGRGFEVGGDRGGGEDVIGERGYGAPGVGGDEAEVVGGVGSEGRVGGDGDRLGFGAFDRVAIARDLACFGPFGSAELGAADVLEVAGGIKGGVDVGHRAVPVKWAEVAVTEEGVSPVTAGGVTASVVNSPSEDSASIAW